MNGAPEEASLLERVRADLVRHPGAVDVARVSRLLREAGQVVGAGAMLDLTARLRDHVEGLGPLQPLVAEGVTDLLVNGDGTVWVEDSTGLRRDALRLRPEEARELAVRLATAGGRRLDNAVPWADAHLPSGIRLHAVLPPLSPAGTVISLRLPGGPRLDLDALQRRGAFPGSARQVLDALVATRVPFLVTGGTGTGKSTLLAALLATVPHRERIVVVEDVLELEVDHPHVVHLQSRHANSEGAGGVDLTVLVRQSLRMRPDRVVLGECRGGEIRELLQALNTGHEGGCGTVHANRARDVPARLEALGALGGLDRAALAAQAASALAVVLHLDREGGVRRLREVALLERDPQGLLAARTALDLGADGQRPGPAWEELRGRLGVPLTEAPGPATAADARTASVAAPADDASAQAPVGVAVPARHGRRAA